MTLALLYARLQNLLHQSRQLHSNPPSGGVHGRSPSSLPSVTRGYGRRWQHLSTVEGESPPPPPPLPSPLRYFPCLPLIPLSRPPAETFRRRARCPRSKSAQNIDPMFFSWLSLRFVVDYASFLNEYIRQTDGF